VAGAGTLQTADTLLDGSTTDNDILEATLTAASNQFVMQNIETINASFLAGSPVLELDNVSGVKTVNVTGSAAGTVDGFAAATTQPVFGVNNITRVVTIQPTTLAGTTAAATAEVINVTVSGLSYGTTAATRSGVTIGDTTNGTLETLNITSSGSTANNFALDMADEGNQAFATINLLGDQDVTIRVSHDEITGITVVGSSNTKDSAVRIDRDGDGTTATNVSNFTDIDNIIVADDNATPAAALVLASVKSGQKITVVDDMATTSSIAMLGATRTAPAASLTLVLDNDTNATDTDFAGTLDIQNTTALTVTSNGNASSSTADTAINSLGTALSGDFTSITVNGDTSVAIALAIDAAGALSDTARTVGVNASGMTGTAFATFTIVNDASTIDTDRLVVYNITGTANADTITATNGDAGNTLDGGAGNDTITGGMGNDTITGGDGNDTINVTVGADRITGGAGNDIIDIDISTIAVAQVDTITPVAGAAVVAAGESVSITLNGITESYMLTAADVAGANVTADIVLITTSLANFINSRFGNVVTATRSDTAVTVTADTAGTPFTLVVTDDSATATTDFAETTATANVGDVNTTLTDFSTDDVINTTGLTGLGVGYIETSTAITDLATDGNYGVVVLTHASFATRNAAEDAVAARMADNTADVVIVFLNSATGKAEAFFDADIGADDTIADSALLFTFDNITTLSGLATVMSSDRWII